MRLVRLGALALLALSLGACGATVTRERGETPDAGDAGEAPKAPDAPREGDAPDAGDASRVLRLVVLGREVSPDVRAIIPRGSPARPGWYPFDAEGASPDAPALQLPVVTVEDARAGEGIGSDGGDGGDGIAVIWQFG
mgnify:CR=1 FL=1